MLIKFNKKNNISVEGGLIQKKKQTINSNVRTKDFFFKFKMTLHCKN